MRMRQKLDILLVTMALPAVLAAQQSATADPAAAANDKLLQALRAKDPGSRIAAVRTAAKTDDDRIAKTIGKALRDKDASVQGAAIQALRYMQSKAALTQLLRAEKRFEKDPELGPSYYLALGQAGDERALTVLMHRAWDPETVDIFRARMMAAAHIRSTKSVKELDRLYNKFQPARAGGRRDVRLGAYRKHLSKAMELLTGIEAPRETEARRAWWLEAKKVRSVTPEPTGLPARDLRSYEKLWAPPRAGSLEPRKRRQRRRRQPPLASRHVFGMLERSPA